MKRILILISLFTLIFTLTYADYGRAFENVISMKTKNVGEKRIPYTLYKIAKTKEYAGMNNWIKENFSDDPSENVFCLPETRIDMQIKGKQAIAFKTWEYNNYVQNILMDNGKYLLLYATPHGTYNPDGEVTFKKLLGITLPITEYTYLSEDEAEGTEENVLTTAEEKKEKAEDVCDVNDVHIAAVSYGTKVGSFDGVTAYSNGSTSYYSGISNYYNGYRTGIKWQCCEYADRYFYAKKGKKITGGNANTYCSNASSKGLSRAWNNSTNKPWVGDIMASNGGPYGHVAIVREVGSNYIKVIHQNWSNSTSDESKTLPMTVTEKNGVKYYNVGNFSSSYPVTCWLW
ncbi:TPA: CHAP domain-containing protein [bacterium]|nr:CHAP domain-containing protein [bacterium]